MKRKDSAHSTKRAPHGRGADRRGGAKPPEALADLARAVEPIAQAGEQLARAFEPIAKSPQWLFARVLDPVGAVDRAMEQWRHEMPEVDTRGAEVLSRARRIVLESRAAIEANFRRHGLDAGEYDVLASLRRAGAPYALRPTELYLSLMISSGGLTARLDRLEDAGLIRRTRATDDARSVIVELTPAGKKKIEAAFRDDMEIENKMVQGLSERDRADLVRLLRKLAQAMRA
jgi:DNA-binding MarR family transcriptional regulator